MTHNPGHAFLGLGQDRTQTKVTGELCQFLSWLYRVPDEADYATAEGFACVKPVVKTRGYSSEGPCLARTEGDWPFGSRST